MLLGVLVVQLLWGGVDGDNRRIALLTSEPLTHNGVELEVLWHGAAKSGGNATACGAFAGTPVRLTLRMRDCSIYSFQFVD
eukprot:COSAG02_NODE_43828_length_371_cov_0.941176_1_plen_81_part_00